jgi:hypothetical protein
MRSEGERLVSEEAAQPPSSLVGSHCFPDSLPEIQPLNSKTQQSSVDLASYRKESRGIDAMKGLGYADQPGVSAEGQKIWDNPSNGTHVNIFFDKLRSILARNEGMGRHVQEFRLSNSRRTDRKRVAGPDGGRRKRQIALTMSTAYALYEISVRF